MTQQKLEAIVLYESDRDHKSEYGGTRTSVKVKLQASDQILEFLDIPKDQVERKVFGGGEGERGEREYLYIKSLAKGEIIQVNTYTKKKTGETDVGFMVPEDWQPSNQSPPPATEAPEETREPVEEKKLAVKAVNGDGVMAGYKGYHPLTPIEKLVAASMLRDCETIFSGALNRAVLLLADIDVSMEKVVELATTLYISVEPWKVRKEAKIADLESLGLSRVPEEPETIKRWLTKGAERKKGIKKNDAMVKFALIGMDKLFPSDAQRHAFMNWVYGKESTKDLTGAQLSTIIDWIGAKEENDYTPNLAAVAESAAIIQEF